MSTPAEDQAFPSVYDGNLGTGGGGMTMREWFAGQALIGILANPTWNRTALEANGLNEGQAMMAASYLAFRYADSMLAEAKK